MRWKDMKLMGRIAMPITLANNDDRALASRGLLPWDEVRQVTIEGVVDTGATRLVIPDSVATQLGLPAAGQVKVRYTDNRSVTKPLVDQVYATLLGRHSVFKALVEPERKDALIGAIVMEDLDFLIDCTDPRLYPRDPDVIVTEAE